MHASQSSASDREIQARGEREQGTEGKEEEWSKDLQAGPGRGVPEFSTKKASLIATLLFVLILSGPPRFRIRDFDASLRGELDWVVLLNIAVWALAGLWVLRQIGNRFYARQRLVHMRLPQILGIVMIVCLTASIWRSPAPELTAFKIYQMATTLFFVQIFTEQFGAKKTLNAMLWGNMLLCLAIAACASFAPSMVWTSSDFNPEPSRLRGELIASTGVVSTLAIILLVSKARTIWRPGTLLLLALPFGLLVLSLERTAYVVMFAFLVLIFLKRPSAKSILQFAGLVCALGLALYAYHLLPSLSHYRDPQDIAGLNDRIGLWTFLTKVTLKRSPWFGLGYYSASRVYGTDYNPGLGTAHSMFFEVLLGGGVVSFVLLVALCCAMGIFAMRALWVRKDRLSFATVSLFIACVLFGSMGDVIDSGPVAIGFWFAATALPWLSTPSMRKFPAPRAAHDPLPAGAAAVQES